MAEGEHQVGEPVLTAMAEGEHQVGEPVLTAMAEVERQVSELAPVQHQLGQRAR